MTTSDTTSATTDYGPAMRAFLAGRRPTGFKQRVLLLALRWFARGEVDPQRAAVFGLLLGPMLLDTGPDVGVETFEFPKDHRMALGLPSGWFFLVSFLDVLGPDPDGDEPIGTIALVTVMMRTWVVDRATGVSTAGAEQAERFIQVLDGTTAATILVGDTAVRETGPPDPRGGLDAGVHFPETSFLTVAGGLTYDGPTWDHESNAPDTAVETMLPLTSIYGADGAPFGFELRYEQQADGHEATYFTEGYRGFAPLPSMKVDYEYYSVAQIPTSGHFTHEGTRYDVRGSSWFDHQFGSRHRLGHQTVAFHQPKQFGGWCWIFQHLDNGDAFTFDAFHPPTPWWKRSIGPGPFQGFGKYIHKGTGEAIPFVGTVTFTEFSASPRTGAEYPIRWALDLHEAEWTGEPGTAAPGEAPTLAPTGKPDGRRLHLELRTIHDDQTGLFANLTEFWEGGTVIHDGALVAHDGTTLETLRGRGFCEGVGFEHPLHFLWRILRFLMR